MNELDRYKGVDYARLVSLCWLKIKEEQQQQIETKKELAQLKVHPQKNKNETFPFPAICWFGPQPAARHRYNR